ncbi:hypothetical protein [Aridibaculum aurantiacum]|uniref:hypothetical protein n=1 Tax=Aridibaculum aurantiacum TaxID=2810307 RepID=UPI001A961914|nr:hypothetical protein [Aridibaculum aurantiacum]
MKKLLLLIVITCTVTCLSPNNVSAQTSNTEAKVPKPVQKAFEDYIISNGWVPLAYLVEVDYVFKDAKGSYVYTIRITDLRSPHEHKYTNKVLVVHPTGVVEERL